MMDSGIADTSSRFNFSGYRRGEDVLLFGVARPGFKEVGFDKHVPMAMDDIQEWSSYVQQQEVQYVVNLLTEKENSKYIDGYVEMLEKCGWGHEQIRMVDATKEDAATEILETIQPLISENVKVCVHCSSGGTRCGLVLAMALMKLEGYEMEEAVQEVLQAASDVGSKRNVSVETLNEFLQAQRFVPVN